MVSADHMSDVAARAKAWYHRRHELICDLIEPWEHGTIARATKYPSYYDFNVVRVEDDPEMSAQELAAFADEALAGLEHRRLHFDLVEAAEPLRADFEAMGWVTERLLFMRHEIAPPPGRYVAVEEVEYDDAQGLREIWHREDHPDQDATQFHAQAREVALRVGAQVLAIRDEGTPIAFAQIQRDANAAEVDSVYVHPDLRGSGLGTALTRAAIDAAGPVDDLWISADDEDRPKELYARLGFRPTFTAMEFLRLPPAPSA